MNRRPKSRTPGPLNRLLDSSFPTLLRRPCSPQNPTKRRPNATVFAKVNFLVCLLQPLTTLPFQNGRIFRCRKTCGAAPALCDPALWFRTPATRRIMHRAVSNACQRAAGAVPDRIWQGDTGQNRIKPDRNARELHKPCQRDQKSSAESGLRLRTLLAQRK